MGRKKNENMEPFIFLFHVGKFIFNGFKGVGQAMSDIAKAGEKKEAKYQKELEERMDNLELEDWQKDLVREGKYDPENFEEDDSTDEDDYYHEDDE